MTQTLDQRARAQIPQIKTMFLEAFPNEDITKYSFTTTSNHNVAIRRGKKDLLVINPLNKQVLSQQGIFKKLPDTWKGLAKQSVENDPETKGLINVLKEQPVFKNDPHITNITVSKTKKNKLHFVIQ